MRDLLRLRGWDDVADLDAPATTIAHGQIIRSKPFLRRLYVDFYRRLAGWLPPQNDGRCVVELGSGGGFIKDIIPDARTSDVLDLPDVDMSFPGQTMPFEDGAVDAFVMLDVLHHLPAPAEFFEEASRCLRPGGRIVMIEPANTVFARFIYQRFHHEGFDPSGPWALSGQGPLSAANGAMPWIIFVRDRERFDREFPELSVIHMTPHTPWRYLLSGGVSMRQLVPSWSYSLLGGLEWLASPLRRWIGMFYTIVVEKGA
jgi:SAM-dependent methyltransferase